VTWVTPGLLHSFPRVRPRWSFCLALARCSTGPRMGQCVQA
jgi:hypothetical protein